jgi:phage-related holin
MPQPTALLLLLQTIYDNAWVRVVFVLLAVNVLTGVAAAFYQRSFYLGELGAWLMTRALPYVIVAGSFQVAVAMLAGYESVLGQYSQWFATMQALIWGFVILALVGHILANLKSIGIPVPDALTTAPKADAKPTP